MQKGLRLSGSEMPTPQRNAAGLAERDDAR